MDRQWILRKVLSEARELLWESLPAAHDTLNRSTIKQLRRLLSIKIVHAACYSADTDLSFVLRRLMLVLRDGAMLEREMIQVLGSILFDPDLDETLGTELNVRVRRGRIIVLRKEDG